MTVVLDVLEVMMLGWVGAFTTLGFVGVAKWVWHIVATSTEETVVERRTLADLNK